MKKFRGGVIWWGICKTCFGRGVFSSVLIVKDLKWWEGQRGEEGHIFSQSNIKNDQLLSQSLEVFCFSHLHALKKVF